MEYEEKLKELEALLQVRFRDRSLLLRAVTHHSCCPDTAVRDSYDTLEFLGDAIISAHVVEYIYRNYPNASEGEMTALKSEVVSRPSEPGHQTAREHGDDDRAFPGDSRVVGGATARTNRANAITKGCPKEQIPEQDRSA